MMLTPITRKAAKARDAGSVRAIVAAGPGQG